MSRKLHQHHNHRHPSNYASLLLSNQLRELQKNPVDGFSVGLIDDADIFRWSIMIEGPQGTLYEGALLPAELVFPEDYPVKPPEMRFTIRNFWHPNVYIDGRVCISILHEAKEDAFNPEEKMEEKWRPILGVESILVSVISLLSDPNFESPANIEASVQMRNDFIAYKRRVRDLVRRSLEL